MIEQIQFLPKKPLHVLPAQQAGATQLTKQFSSFLNDAIHELNDQHTHMDKLNDKFVAGEIADAHQLTIAAEKLALSLEMTVQIRNKVIEAYQEVMRTQI